MDHAMKLYSHLGEAHPEIIDARLAELAIAHDVRRHVELSAEPRERAAPTVSGGGHD